MHLHDDSQPPERTPERVERASVSDVPAFDPRALRSPAATVVPPTRLASARSLPVLAIGILFVAIVTAGVAGAQRAGGVPQQADSRPHQSPVGAVASPAASSSPGQSGPAVPASIPASSPPLLRVAAGTLVVVDQTSEVLLVSVNGVPQGELDCRGATLLVDGLALASAGSAWLVEVDHLPGGRTDEAIVRRLPHGLVVTDAGVTDAWPIPDYVPECDTGGPVPSDLIAQAAAEAAAFAMPPTDSIQPRTASHLLRYGEVETLLPLPPTYPVVYAERPVEPDRWVWVVDLVGTFELDDGFASCAAADPGPPAPGASAACPRAHAARVIVDATSGEITGRVFYVIGP